MLRFTHGSYFHKSELFALEFYLDLFMEYSTIEIDKSHV